MDGNGGNRRELFFSFLLNIFGHRLLDSVMFFSLSVSGGKREGGEEVGNG